MNGHLTKKELIELVAGTAGNALLKKWERHGAECSRCRKRYETYAALTTPRYREVVFRSEDVKARIDAQWQTMRAGEGIPPHELQAKRPRRSFRQAFAFSILVAMVPVALYLVFRWPGTGVMRERGMLPFQVVHGTVAVDGVVRTGKSSVDGGAEISLGSNAAAELALSGRFRIVLKGGTAFSVRSVKVSPEGNINKMEFVLHRGSLMSDFPHGKQRISYTYNTPQSRVESLGTKFILTAGSRDTVLVMEEGEVLLTSLRSGEKITARSGTSYRIRDKIAVLMRGKGKMSVSDVRSRSGNTGTKGTAETAVPAASGEKGAVSSVKDSDAGSREVRGEQKEMRRSADEMRREQRELRELRSGGRGLRSGR